MTIFSTLLLSILFDITDKKYDQSTIKNINSFTDKIKDEHPAAEFKYHNDSYLIYEDTSNKKYIIKKFDELF